VDHAGLSQPLVLLKVLKLSPLELSNLTQSNNSLTAQPKTMDAMEVLWTMPSNTSNLILLSLKLTTHTKLKLEHAHTLNLQELVKLSTSLMSNLNLLIK